MVLKFVMENFGNFLNKSSGIKGKKWSSLVGWELGKVASGRIRVGDAK